MKIGIMGGTFDPIHKGHLALARAARNQYFLDKVLFIPAFLPPHKEDRCDLIAPRHRYRMVELAVCGENGFEVSDLELKRGRVSYTIDTLRELRRKYPQDEFFMILGADTLKDIPNWHEASRVGDYVRLLAAPRGGVCENEIRSLGADWIQMSECPVSSSQIRRKMLDQQDITDDVPSRVADYILRMKLYGPKPCIS